MVKNSSTSVVSYSFWALASHQLINLSLILQMFVHFERQSILAHH